MSASSRRAASIVAVVARADASAWVAGPEASACPHVRPLPPARRPPTAAGPARCLRPGPLRRWSRRRSSPSLSTIATSARWVGWVGAGCRHCRSTRSGGRAAAGGARRALCAPCKPQPPACLAHAERPPPRDRLPRATSTPALPALSCRCSPAPHRRAHGPSPRATTAGPSPTAPARGSRRRSRWPGCGGGSGGQGRRRRRRRRQRQGRQAPGCAAPASAHAATRAACWLAASLPALRPVPATQAAAYATSLYLPLRAPWPPLCPPRRWTRARWGRPSRRSACTTAST